MRPVRDCTRLDDKLGLVVAHSSEKRIIFSMQTRKRTAILAKTDWLSVLDPDTLDLVLSQPTSELTISCSFVVLVTRTANVACVSFIVGRYRLLGKLTATESHHQPGGLAHALAT